MSMFILNISIVFLVQKKTKGKLKKVHNYLHFSNKNKKKIHYIQMYNIVRGANDK